MDAGGALRVSSVPCLTGSRFSQAAYTVILEGAGRTGYQTLAIAGIHLSDIPTLNYQRHLFQERQVRSVTSNTRADARELLALAGAHHIEVTTPQYPLDAADVALNDLASGRISGAAVLSI